MLINRLILLILNFKKMKNLFIGLMTFGFTIVASASNEVIVNPKNVVLIENVDTKNLVETNVEKASENDRTVTCSIYANGRWNTGSYSCFFCWGGANNSCISTLARELNIVM